jgi:hypothetical protein
VGARARADPDRPPRLNRDGDDSNQADEKNENDVLSSRERVCRALCAWTYPADPMEPELIAALRRAPGSAGKAWLERRLDDGWREALLGAYAALRVGDCPFFYVVFPERVALFCAPFSASGAGAGAGGIASAANERDAKTKTHDSKKSRDDETKNGKGAEGFAVVTEASVGKFRDALVAARVPHVCVGADPLARSKRAGRAGFTGLSKRAGADGDGRGYGGAYGHGIPLEEWAQEDFEEAYKDEEDFQALDAHGKPLVRSPERLARRNGVRLMERDARAAERAVIVRGAAAVHALVCLMTEAAATGGDPAGAASAARDAPLIMAPAPFAGASLRRVDLRVSRAETTYEIGDEPKSPPPPREEARAGEKRKKKRGQAPRVRRGVRERERRDADPAVVRVPAGRGAVRRASRERRRVVQNARFVRRAQRRRRGGGFPVFGKRNFRGRRLPSSRSGRTRRTRRTRHRGGVHGARTQTHPVIVPARGRGRGTRRARGRNVVRQPGAQRERAMRYTGTFFYHRRYY